MHRLCHSTVLLALNLAAAAVFAPIGARAQDKPTVNNQLQQDLPGYANQQVMVNVATFAPHQALAWHVHPGAHEIVYGLEGALTTEIEGQGTKIIRRGDIGFVPADLVHRARNDDSTVPAKVLVIHIREDKNKPVTRAANE